MNSRSACEISELGACSHASATDFNGFPPAKVAHDNGRVLNLKRVWLRLTRFIDLPWRY
jgi:hypothetical protein